MTASVVRNTLIGAVIGGLAAGLVGHFLHGQGKGEDAWLQQGVAFKEGSEAAEKSTNACPVMFKKGDEWIDLSNGWFVKRIVWDGTKWFLVFGVKDTNVLMVPGGFRIPLLPPASSFEFDVHFPVTNAPAVNERNRA